MSRSTASETLQNPATKWFEWSGSEGKVKYYDRENKQNVFIDLPFAFLVLDTLTTITGYSDSHQAGIWANEIKDVRKDVLKVRTKGATLGEGLYADVKAIQGAKYTQSVYIAYKTENGLEIGNLKLSGSAVGPWIEFRKKHNVFEGAIVISGKTEEKKGATKYFAPTFTTKQTTDETNAQAVELDKQLQEYLKSYFSAWASELDVVHDEVTVNENFVTAAAGAISSSINGTQVQDPTADAPFDATDAPYETDLDLPF